MNKNELNQIIFNALETERTKTKSEEYRKTVERAIKAHRHIMDYADKPSPSVRGICRKCGSQDISIPCE